MRRRLWMWLAPAVVVVAVAGGAVAVADGPRSQTAAAGPATKPTPQQTIPIAISGWKPGDMRLLALHSGILRATPDGCPYLAQEGPGSVTRTALVWPAGTIARYGADGKVEVVAPHGSVVVREGDEFSVGGGHIPQAEEGPCTFGASDAFVIMDDLVR